jgi:hypothetical protein
MQIPVSTCVTFVALVRYADYIKEKSLLGESVKGDFREAG